MATPGAGNSAKKVKFEYGEDIRGCVLYDSKYVSLRAACVLEYGDILPSSFVLKYDDGVDKVTIGSDGALQSALEFFGNNLPRFFVIVKAPPPGTQLGVNADLASSKRKKTDSSDEQQTREHYFADTRRNFVNLPLNSRKYHDIRNSMCFFKDITGIVDLLANEKQEAFSFLRPPRFGKSLLLEVLGYFHDVNHVDNFEFYFKGTAAYKSKDIANKSLVFNLDLSNVTPLYFPFLENLASTITQFKWTYSHLVSFPQFVPGEDGKLNVLKHFKEVLDAIQNANRTVVILIDEYDTPVNRWMLNPERHQEVRDQMEAMVSFYATVKKRLGSLCVPLCFLTGVFRMTLAEISNGFNCYRDISFDPKYVSLLGLTQDDVNCLIASVGNVQEEFLDTLKLECNGYRFAHNIESLYCTNFVFVKIVGIGSDLVSLHNTTGAPAVLDYISTTASGRDLMNKLLAGTGVQYNIGLDDPFKFKQLAQDDNFGFATSILLHLGLVTYSEQPGLVKLTNPSTRSLVARHLFGSSLSFGIDDAYLALVEKNNIAPLIDHISRVGVFVSTKAESLSHNEIVPHNMFIIAACMSKLSLVSYEYHTDTTDPVSGGYWLDCLVYGRQVEHVVEWKNLQLDFLVVPGQDNNSFLVSNHKPEALQKANAIRDMTNEQVLELKIASFSKYNAKKTVKMVLQETFDQTRNYVSALRIHPQHKHISKFYMHVCVAVGSAKIVFDSKEYIHTQ